MCGGEWRICYARWIVVHSWARTPVMGTNTLYKHVVCNFAILFYVQVVDVINNRVILVMSYFSVHTTCEGLLPRN